MLIRTAIITSTFAGAAFIAAAPAALAATVPFTGTYHGTMQVTEGGPSGPQQATYSGPGRSTRLGRSMLNGTVNITGPAQACTGFDASHEETLTTAKGDLLTVTETEESCTKNGSTFHCTGTYTITGGTGRFAGATGDGSWTGRLSFDQAAGTGTFITGYSGTLTR